MHGLFTWLLAANGQTGATPTHRVTCFASAHIRPCTSSAPCLRRSPYELTHVGLADPPCTQGTRTGSLALGQSILSSWQLKQGPTRRFHLRSPTTDSPEAIEAVLVDYPESRFVELMLYSRHGSRPSSWNGPPEHGC